MKENSTLDFLLSQDNGSEDNVLRNVSSGGDDVAHFYVLAMSYLTYKIGDAINKYYFLILVPVGAMGNILSFMVMMQKHNRHMSISVYLSALAVTDTASLLLALLTNLVDNGSIKFQSNFPLYCKLHIIFYMTSTISSTLLVLSMTFERFYSIMRPHKAASFNTVKRAKIMVICVITLCSVVSIPNWYTTEIVGDRCLALMNSSIPGQIYDWLVGKTLGFFFPFACILIMNCIIIVSLRKRSKSLLLQTNRDSQSQGHGQGRVKGRGQKLMKSEKNIFAILFLVTFSFLILTFPSGVLLIFTLFVDYQKTPKMFADFFLVLSVSHRCYVTNFGINFFLYVISGKKFRTDLVHLFKKRDRTFNTSSTTQPSTLTLTSINVT